MFLIRIAPDSFATFEIKLIVYCSLYLPPRYVWLRLVDLLSRVVSIGGGLARWQRVKWQQHGKQR